MKLFHLLKKILLEIQQKDKLIDLKTIKKQNGLLILRYIAERGLEQEIVAKALGVLLENIKAGHFSAKRIFFTGKIAEVVDLCLDRIAEIRGVEVLKV